MEACSGTHDVPERDVTEDLTTSIETVETASLVTAEPPRPIRSRTQDVLSTSKSFVDLLVPEPLIRSLTAAGFTSPSPVQQACIPLGRMGSDLIVQAKSGTGKTVTFAVICLERVQVEIKATQALLMAPTREIAIQSEQVINRLIDGLPEDQRPECSVFVGGLNIVADEKRLRRLVHIAVGTPGRLCSLLQSGALPPRTISTLVLDEADTLLSEAFYSDVTWAYDQLPKRKQVLAFSATYTPELLEDLEPLMKRPQRIMLCPETTSLEGVRQFYRLVGDKTEVPSEGPSDAGGVVRGRPTAAEDVDEVFASKVEALLQLLSSLSFHQAAVFLNRKPQAEWLAARLTSAGFPASYLSGGDRPQEERMQAMEAVRAFKLRVIVSTDVMARGVDLDRVNVVANLDLPRDSATYVHRVGRTGRFGSLGVSVSYVTPGELKTLRGYLEEAQAGHIEPLPSDIPPDMYSFESAQTEWESQALADLKQAPKVEGGELPPPPSLKKKADLGGAIEAAARSQEAAAAERVGVDAAPATSGIQPEDDQSGDSGWFYVRNYGWQYDPKYGREWAAYYRQLYGEEESSTQYADWHSRHGGHAAPVMPCPPAQAYYSGGLPPPVLVPADAPLTPLVDMQRKYSEAYHEYVTSTSPAGAFPGKRADQEASFKSGEDEDEAHLRLDVLSGRPCLDHPNSGSIAEYEVSDEDGMGDLPKSEDLEDHASELIERLTVLNVPTADGSSREALDRRRATASEAAATRQPPLTGLGDGSPHQGPPHIQNNASAFGIGQSEYIGHHHGPQNYSYQPDSQPHPHCPPPHRSFPPAPHFHYYPPPPHHHHRHHHHLHRPAPPHFHHHPPPHHPHHPPPHYPFPHNHDSSTAAHYTQYNGQRHGPWHQEESAAHTRGCPHCQMGAFYDQYSQWREQYSAWQKEFFAWQQSNFQ